MQFISSLFQRLFLVFILLVLLWPGARPATAQSDVETALDELATLAYTGAEAAEHGDALAAQQIYDEIHEVWETIEDTVKAQDPNAYVELESALDAVKVAVLAPSPNVGEMEHAYDHLRQEVNEIGERFAGGHSLDSLTAEVTPAEMLTNINAAYEAVEAGRVEEANEALTQAIRIWPIVEGGIAAKAPDTYTAIEVDLGRAIGALQAQPANLLEAEVVLADLHQMLSPFAVITTYTVLDAAAVILREGLEALLVIIALLAFLKRAGHTNQQGWVWLGSLLGLVASIMVAFGLQTLFNQVSAGQNREIIEGATSIIAAAMLFYVSYWLHSKSSMRSWQKYIDAQVTQALARGNMYGLALLAFLAIFREGAETAVFYLGMATAITLENLLLGLAIGIAILLVIAVLILKVGMRLPLRYFFMIAGIMVYYLGFKFLGAGIHALQVADALPAMPIATLPTISLLGFYPSWLTVIPQVLLLLFALVVVLYLRMQDNKFQLKQTSPT